MTVSSAIQLGPRKGVLFYDRYRQTPQERLSFARVRNAERSYMRQLVTIARYIEQVAKSFVDGDSFDAEPFISFLNRYAELLHPWAEAVAERMIADVNRRDERAWRQHASMMGIELRRELQGPTGTQLRALQNEQVELITSLPREAAKRVHEITFGNLYENLRGKALVQEIMDTGRVTRSRAELIARTEVARAGSNLTQIRARSVGSTHYIWRAALDRRVRETHRKMNGKVIAWNDPPVVDPGVPPYHAGCIWNCRCYAESILPL